MTHTISGATTVLCLSAFVAAQKTSQAPPFGVELRINDNVVHQHEPVFATVKVTNTSDAEIECLSIDPFVFERLGDDGRWGLARGYDSGCVSGGDPSPALPVGGMRYREELAPSLATARPGKYRVAVMVTYRRGSEVSLREERVHAEFTVREHVGNAKAIANLRDEPYPEPQLLVDAFFCERMAASLRPRLDAALGTTGITAGLRRWLLVARANLMLAGGGSDDLENARRDLALVQSFPLPSSVCGSFEGRVEYLTRLCDVRAAVDNDAVERAAQLYLDYAEKHPGIGVHHYRVLVFGRDAARRLLQLRQVSGAGD